MTLFIDLKKRKPEIYPFQICAWYVFFGKLWFNLSSHYFREPNVSNLIYYSCSFLLLEATNAAPAAKARPPVKPTLIPEPSPVSGNSFELALWLSLVTLSLFTCDEDGWLITKSVPATTKLGFEIPLSLAIWFTVVLCSLAISSIVSPAATLWVVPSTVLPDSLFVASDEPLSSFGASLSWSPSCFDESFPFSVTLPLFWSCSPLAVFAGVLLSSLLLFSVLPAVFVESWFSLPDVSLIVLSTELDGLSSSAACAL